MNPQRRDFFRWLVCCVLGTSGLPFAFPRRLAHAAAAPRVVISKQPRAIADNGAVEAAAVHEMLRAGICSLTKKNTPAAAWSCIFSPAERVGIKVNVLGGPQRCTHPQLVDSIIRQLAEAGIPERNIIIFDRLTSELARCGYTIRRENTTVQCYGTDSAYESKPEISGSIGSCFSRILTRMCDALITVPVLKDHDLSGVSLSLKNSYGLIHNPNKYHDNGCDPYIADLNAHPNIKNKLRLVIIDGLTAQCNGGPAYKPQWSWPFSGLLLSHDPVAADTIGAHIIEEQRKKNALASLKDEGREPVHIRTAASQGLGVHDMQVIEKVVL